MLPWGSNVNQWVYISRPNWLSSFRSNPGRAKGRRVGSFELHALTSARISPYPSRSIVELERTESRYVNLSSRTHFLHDGLEYGLHGFFALCFGKSRLFGDGAQHFSLSHVLHLGSVQRRRTTIPSEMVCLEGRGGNQQKKRQKNLHHVEIVV